VPTQAQINCFISGSAKFSTVKHDDDFITPKHQETSTIATKPMRTERPCKCEEVILTVPIQGLQIRCHSQQGLEPEIHAC
jgi:hypothetical protein